MKVFPKITGTLCANSHPGSYTGQDAFNDMFPVYRRSDEMVLLRERSIRNDRTVPDIEHAGLYARPEIYFEGGGTTWITVASMSYAA